MPEHQLRVLGMHCAGCSAAVEDRLRKVAGVKEVRVSLDSGRAYVRCEEATSPEALIRAVESAGYRAQRVEDGSAEAEADEARLRARSARVRMAVAWAFTAPIAAWMSIEMATGRMWPDPRSMRLGVTLLALPVLAWAGGPTFASAFRSVLHRSAGMDLLIALGAGAAYCTGPLGLLWASPHGGGVPDYSGLAAMIVAFHLTGRHLEAAARGRTSRALERLVTLGARSARVLRGAEEVEVPIGEVQVGDRMVVRPGGRIPTDGVVEEGESEVDESLATGESAPRALGPGSHVIGATLNGDGLLMVRATRVGNDTFLAQVIRTVREAQASKVPVQEVADRVTRRFVPLVVGLAALTAAAWLAAPDPLRALLRQAAPLLPWVEPDGSTGELALIAAIAVLVISCPCALGLATPTALAVGLGKGAEAGVLFRRGEAIELLREVGTIVLDKTGTVTRGKMALSAVEPAPGWEAADVLRFLAAAEVPSEHPLGRAVVAGARARGIALLPARAFEAARGRGVRCEVEGYRVIAGTRRFLREVGIDPEPLESRAALLEARGETVVFAAIDGDLLGISSLADEIKEEAPRVLEALRAMGFELVLLTGDNARAARAAAERLGIADCRAELLPGEKREQVIALRRARAGARRPRVAMVGDGINDAPALAEADVGIALGTGADVAVESGDVVLVGGDLGGLLKAIALSGATFRTIRQNLFWAFAYNLVAIPLAMLGLLHPLIAEGAMAASSLTVVGNALLLRRLELDSPASTPAPHAAPARGSSSAAARSRS